MPPHRPEPLPPQLAGPFSIERARQARLTASRLRAHDLERRVWGTRDVAGAYDNLESRCALFAERLPRDVFFSHTTAARLMRVPLPRAVELDATVDVSVEAPRRAPHADGLRGHSRRVPHGDVQVLRSFRVSSPERTWCELAGRLTLEELVAAGDHLIHHRAPWTTIASLTERIAVGDPLSRSSRLRMALALLDDHAESPQESRLRVVLHRAGLPRPEVNRVVVSSEAGRAIRSDLSYPSAKLVIEYQGDYHRDKRQWRDDMTRRTRLEEDGWYVLEVNRDDLVERSALVARIRRLLARRR